MKSFRGTQHKKTIHKTMPPSAHCYEFDLARWEGEGGLIRTKNALLKLKKVKRKSRLDLSRWEDEGGMIYRVTKKKVKSKSHH